jgi:hypothetical protein
VVAHSVNILRVCRGLLIAGFGALKFFPGVSPAQPLVTRAVDLLTFGAITGQTAHGGDRDSGVHRRLHPGVRTVLLPGLVLLAFEDKNELLAPLG